MVKQATVCAENVIVIFYKLKYRERDVTFFYMLLLLPDFA